MLPGQTADEFTGEVCPADKSTAPPYTGLSAELFKRMKENRRLGRLVVTRPRVGFRRRLGGIWDGILPPFCLDYLSGQIS
jgi:hypothetical protein